jgi:hypothetical protein
VDVDPPAVFGRVATCSGNGNSGDVCWYGVPTVGDCATSSSADIEVFGKVPAGLTNVRRALCEDGSAEADAASGDRFVITFNGMEGALEAPERLLEAASKSGVLCVCCRYGGLPGTGLAAAF